MLYLLLIVLCCLYVVWKLRIKISKTHLEPPELYGWLPIIGHGYKIMRNSEQLFNSIVAVSDECLKKGGVVTFQLGPRKLYGITDPEDSLTMMNACLEKSYLFKFLEPYLGNGLLIADVERWHISRKLLNTAFNQKVLDGFIDIFNTQAEALVNKFTSDIGKPFDHEKLLRINNLETICATSFDVDADKYDDIYKNYLLCLTNLLKQTSNRVQNFWLHIDFIYNMTREKKLLDEVVNGIINLSKTIIQNKKTERNNQGNEKNTYGKPKTFIDHILDVAEETGCFTDEEIRAEIDNIIAAGHDTTASCLTFALTLLGSHGDVQEKLCEEIFRVCGSSDTIDKDGLPKLVYTEAVLKETLRLYPIGLVLPRYTYKDIKLKNFTLHANHDCLVFVHGLHRHSIWGPDADQFRPERWLDKETLPDPKYYAGFGLGRRSCIGKVYAMMSMKILLAHVIRRYRVSSDISKMVMSFEMMSRPKSGYFITLEERETLQ